MREQKLRPVDQLILADPDRGDGHNTEGVPGDCWRACIATILRLHPNQVPHFIHQYPATWWDESRIFVEDRHPGFELVYRDRPEFPEGLNHNYLTTNMIGMGPSPRGDFLHSVIFNNHRMIHDPHPSRAGITNLQAVFFIGRTGTIQP